MTDIRLKILNLYDKMPEVFQIGISNSIKYLPDEIVYGSTFVKTKEEIRKTEFYSAEQIKNYQFKKLKQILIYSYENCEYYNDLFKSSGFNPYNFTNINDISKIPYLDKDIIRKNLKNILNKNYKSKNYRYVTTSGSTGIPLGFYLDRDISIKEWAFMTEQWKRIGYDLKDKRVVIRGLITNNGTNNKLWCKNLLRNELILSSFHMTDYNMGTYMELINEFKPQFIHCYPSSIYNLARFLNKNKNIKIPELKGILAGSENVYDYQRKFVEEVFQCRYYSWYGQSERVILAGECECSEYYHVYPQYGYIELVDEKGSIITENGKEGEIVGTSFLNKSMPFIRYKTGDIAEYTFIKCNCGRSYFLLKKVKGRLQEYIICKDKNLVSFTALNMHSNIFDNVKQYQFYQDKIGTVILRIVRDELYNNDDTELILYELNNKLKNQVDIIVEFVDKINLTVSGKYRTVEQKLNINQFI